ncbi:helix-turn-helix transcriptional regulator [Candidatus Pantoea floridensis]|uniref:Helix-turn-helix n=1 Tax=Candidatus Pantoea floridensis TaxID=1938870 RepID=A0A286BTY1_9GAMM|nr:helix-turn-helix transcriptional regulator [Pantoea floridensis]PIF24125.1 helix-turn-helix protein [Enterobacteriaceae bacterium JKS000233]SOD37578.1 Helix-turn-helix [Pantoea floridensis]
MSTTYSEKLRLIRIAEGLTQTQLRDLTGLGLSTIRNYETHLKEPGLKVVDKFLSIDLFQKYTLWLMTNRVAPEAGQIAPKGAEDLDDEGDNADAANQ